MVVNANLLITGIVQGVGFRPFIYGLAKKLSLRGWVRNTSGGVEIEVEGEENSIDKFYHAIIKEAPPLAVIDQITMDFIPVKGYTEFQIFHSASLPQAFQPISPDISICPDCLSELFNPLDRRYLYPFINCTNCGPRFTIINDIPYDRCNTTMSDFEMCPDCKAEYNDPVNRRFHAQPIACPICGPHIWLENSSHTILCSKNDVIIETQKLLLQGKIIAIKGLGGFHIACDATNTDAVELLRKRKLRIDKPFALMMPDIDTVKKHCHVSVEESALLESRERPIVILERLNSSNIAKQIAPNQNTIGVMLPYTPLHYLLLSNSLGNKSPIADVLVMTSGNVSEEPIAFDNDQARSQLSGLVDYFILHNRPIQIRCDDSVLRYLPENKSNLIIRRSRGYTPYPINLPWKLPQILATGAELKNTFCFTRDYYAFTSHHIGDLENYETLISFEEGIKSFEKLFKIQPELIAHDLHPNYLSTQYAIDRSSHENIKIIGIQHHHAHIASCMSENHIPSNFYVIGLSFDGTGYGTDGSIWGGEIFLSDYKQFNRLFHLKYYRLPGGEMAIRNPARAAIAYLLQSNIDLDSRLSPLKSIPSDQLSVIRSQLTHQINSPYTSSMGRLFDVVASLAGLRHSINYEAQAAIELEAIIDHTEKSAYEFVICQSDLNNSIIDQSSQMVIDPSPVLAEIVRDYLSGCPPSIISAKFHNGLVNMIIKLCCEIRKQYSISDVVLSGGVWQNQTLLTNTIINLRKHQFNPIIHNTLPPNDGGLSLGQAIIAYHQLFS